MRIWVWVLYCMIDIQVANHRRFPLRLATTVAAAAWTTLPTRTTRLASWLATASPSSKSSSSSSGRSNTCSPSRAYLIQPSNHFNHWYCRSAKASSYCKSNQSCWTTSLVSRGGSSSGSAVPTTALFSTSTMVDADTKVTPPVEIFRRDYQPLPYTVESVRLKFELHPGKTIVTSAMTLRKNPHNDNLQQQEAAAGLVLDGDETSVRLIRVTLDGRDLTAAATVETSGGDEYTLSPGKLTLHQSLLQDQSLLEIQCEIVPETNTQLSGLYQSTTTTANDDTKGGSSSSSSSNSMYCTQCEAMGFRRITYYPDRPDNMAIFSSVRIEADADLYPLLLSNGNLVEQGMIVAAEDASSMVPDSSSASRRHYAVWSDPYPKPSYLFALVAGNLGCRSGTFTTASGRVVSLRLYAEPSNVHKLQYALEALQRAMEWDEERFGLEYDLDLYNIVAVDSFNMGAMENKGLNIFNTAYVLADAETATDGDFERVEAVIAHEYFHNWTGNRVTCRDWFQLTLKEGLTVFRDQEFSGDMGSKAVKRIEDVRGLRARQFNEDAGPMSHPIRPESYISMDNFYTGTVYIKGAEVIRMYQTILTEAGFRKGMDLYFERHDGSAVTCDDFLSAMQDANGVDLSQFSRWYSTAGTPTITYATSYEAGTLTLTLTQSSNSKEGPLHIPVSIGLLDKATGKEVLPTKVLDLKEEEQTFTFDGLDGDVFLSILRGFSAPVKVFSANGEVDEESMAFLAARDTDGFLRWEAGQNLYTSLIFQTMKKQVSETTKQFVSDAFERALTDTETADFSIQAYTLILPTESTLAEDMAIVDPIGIHNAREDVKKALARQFEKELRVKYNSLTKAMEDEGDEFKVDAQAVGRRRLRNVLLEYLCSIRSTDDEQVAAANLAENHFRNAKGMTDKMAGLAALASMDGKGATARDAALDQFYRDAKGDSLVLNKWFTVQATADLPDVLERVKQLTSHPDFTLRNPNRCRSLIGAYASNSAAFHDEQGESYKFTGDVLAELDQLNPQISSRLAGNLIQWRKFDEVRGQKMKAELEKLAALKLSDDLYEIVTRGLK